MASIEIKSSKTWGMLRTGRSRYVMKCLGVQVVNFMCVALVVAG